MNKFTQYEEKRFQRLLSMSSYDVEFEFKDYIEYFNQVKELFERRESREGLNENVLYAIGCI
jgi:hypothetical protein